MCAQDWFLQNFILTCNDTSMPTLLITAKHISAGTWSPTRLRALVHFPSRIATEPTRDIRPLPQANEDPIYQKQQHIANVLIQAGHSTLEFFFLRCVDLKYLSVTNLELISKFVSEKKKNWLCDLKRAGLVTTGGTTALYMFELAKV